MIYYYEFVKKAKKVIYEFSFRFELFNPLRKTDIAVIVPTFEVVPRIGIRFRRDIEGKFIELLFVIGWFNFSSEFRIRYIRRVWHYQIQ